MVLGIVVELPHLRLRVSREEILHAFRRRIELALEIGLGVIDHLVGIGHADGPIGAQPVGDIPVVEKGSREVRIAGHDRFGHDGARVLHMHRVPFVGIFSPDAGEVGPGPLRPPLEGMVVHALRGEAVMAVALDLVAQ